MPIGGGSESQQQTHGYRYYCGTPKEHCSGGTGKLLPAMSNLKSHSTSGEARKCHVRYLISEGYVRGDDARSYVDPQGIKPTVVIGKETRFGTRMRPGKAGRYMPKGCGGAITLT